MTTQAYPYLVLTDGTTTITFADGAGGATAYPPLRGQWAPAIAGLRVDQMGGRSPYADVVEEILINIVGTTAADCYSKLDSLARLLDQADHWWLRGDEVSPVLLKFAPQGSTIASGAAPWQAVVLGRAPGDETSGVRLPAVYADSGMIWQIPGVKVRILRRGLWCLAATTAASSTGQHPITHTCTFGSSQATPAPLDLSIDGFTRADIGLLQTGYVLVAPPSRITLAEAEAGGWNAPGAGTASTVADSTAKASGGSVKRLASGAPGQFDTSFSVSNLPNRLTIFAAVRVNNVVNIGTIQAVGYSNGTIVSVSPSWSIPYNGGAPQILNLGTLICREGFTTIGIVVTVTANNASGIDCDYFVAIDLADDLSRVIALNDTYAYRFQSLASGTALTAALKSGVLDDQSPGYSITASGNVAYIVYAGDAFLLTGGTQVGVMLLLCANGYWRPGSTTVSSVVTASRYPATLTPQ